MLQGVEGTKLKNVDRIGQPNLGTACDDPQVVRYAQSHAMLPCACQELLLQRHLYSLPTKKQHGAGLHATAALTQQLDVHSRFCKVVLRPGYRN